MIDQLMPDHELVQYEPPEPVQTASTQADQASNSGPDQVPGPSLLVSDNERRPGPVDQTSESGPDQDEWTRPAEVDQEPVKQTRPAKVDQTKPRLELVERTTPVIQEASEEPAEQSQDEWTLPERKSQTKPRPKLTPVEPVKKKGTRKTGLDREVAQRITDYILTGNDQDQPIAEGKVAAKFEVGKPLLRKLYEQLRADGIIAKDGKGNQYPWYRVSSMTKADQA